MTPRPNSLAEIASRAADGASFEYELADFLHEFQRRPSVEMLIEQPLLLQSLAKENAVKDAYLAAVAVTLSRRIQCPTPAWTRDQRRTLEYPWFASAGRHMRALLLVESPGPFRERNLFVTANALSVA